LANRLWDYDGFVSVSELTKETYLIEFPTASICDWVLSRLWHVHHLPLFLKRWSLNIEPIVLQPTEIPTWIQLIGVPVPLCTHLGIGHLASLIGKPISKFVRNGTVVKVCVLMSSVDERPAVLKVTVAGIVRDIEVVYPEVRGYAEQQKKPGGDKPNTKTIWKQTGRTVDSDVPNVDSAAAEVAVPETVQSQPEKDSPGTSEKGDTSLSGLVIEVTEKDSDSSSSSASEGDKNAKTDDPLSPENFPPFKRVNRRGRKR
ncbi:hypothetical protein LINPERHAP2_LOCUS24255, partial [Linum perenne]